MTMAVGFLSLPTELICHILILLHPRDISRCAMTCNIFWLVVQNSVYIQYKLEIYAQGLISTGTVTMNSTGAFRKSLCSLKKLASLWRSDFHATTTFETVVTTAATYLPVSWEHMLPIQNVQCGLWWSDSPEEDEFYIQGCGTNPTLSQTWPIGDAKGFFTFDPLQDLMVVCSEPDDDVAVTDAKQDYHVCWVEFRLASSQRPHPSAACTSLECKHTFDAPGYYFAAISPPVICGDHVFILYDIEDTGGCHPEPVPGMLIQVINWRKGYVNRHFLCQLDFCELDLFYPVDEQKFVIIGPESIHLYTLQGLNGPPQCRIIYHLPKILHLSSCDSKIFVHGHPSLHGKAAHPGLMPSYVPSLESQIMVVEFLPEEEKDAILVIDMAIFSDKALRSDMLVDIPWSDWGPQYACYFPHHESYHISVFGSKMAYALPQDRIPDPDQTLEGLSSEGYIYVHIWDFNKRVIARSESVDDPDSPDFRICKPGQIIDSFGEDIVSNRAYIATVCRTPFPAAGSCIFLEQDRLTVTRTDVGPDITE
ncbi:uncharacterized protein HD556DRAFT_1035629 [Suillus plorans]|uniref:F-box domain-containing protein n=1 Tax=Suillus plorans TaxID=116603 RepID=A0A9P7DQ76_9AGAM|nr:uncharacterized protein HD556DRAFT_1035629 [Suillus plorans]KAG1800425.1 hypothetical protein HD556DRAFT_1035629 [Suillus plorans]